MPSRDETTREPLIKRMFLGDSAPNKREESILPYIIHCIDEDVRPTSTGGLKMLRGNPRRVRQLPATRKCRRHAAAACEEFERNKPGAESVDTLASSMTATVFLHVSFDKAHQVPDRLVHQLSVKTAAAPPGQQEITEKVGPTKVDRRDVKVVGPPLRGSNYIAADSCCDATRHTRATLPINGKVWLAQRYAVDYEQLDANNRVWSGKKRENLENYTIYGKKAIAAADGKVVKVVDGLPEQVPGIFPEGISAEEADGNSVILALGGGNYALYAHFQPGSIRVEEGDRVKRGDVLALVGNSGNSLAPHLHFHVMNGPLSLASNGLPYEVDSFKITGKNPGGTAAFDKAEAEGTPLKVDRVDPAKKVTEAMPLDQLVVSFD